MPNPNLNDIFPVENPVTVRAAAALLGGGAWDATPTEFSVANAHWITLYITYTRAAAGGAIDIQAQWSPYAVLTAGVENWFTQSLYSAGAVAGGADSQSRVQREYVTYSSTAVGAETIAYGPIRIEGTVERLRVACRESGAVANPGTVHIVAIVA